MCWVKNSLVTEHQLTQLNQQANSSKCKTKATNLLVEVVRHQGYSSKLLRGPQLLKVDILRGRTSRASVCRAICCLLLFKFVYLIIHLKFNIYVL